MNFNIEEKLKTLPDKSGVYIMKNSEGDIIYVGKAKILKNRVRQYFKSHNHPPKVKKMVENIDDFEYIITDSEKEALILENNLIKENMPKYNILLKDDKTYPFIKITLADKYPGVYMTRRVIKDGARYFGPYCSGINVHDLLEIISEVFCLKKCKKNFTGDEKQKRPCLYHQMGKCGGACMGYISEYEYRKNVMKVIDFLNGKTDEAVKILSEKMKNAAQKLDFETAAFLRDKIQAVSVLGEKQKIVSATGKDCDAISLWNADNFTCVEMFFIRSGKIIGKEHYFIQDTDMTEAGEILSVFLKRYYEDSSFIPYEILVSCEIEDSEAIEQWLSSKVKRNVKIIVPKIGDKYRLLTMIQANAHKQHSERELKIMRDISFKDNALSSLQKIMKLDTPPFHMEAYDISNTSGIGKVGAMVTYINGKPCREKYRNFKIKYIAGQDDYSCMREVISRRIEHGLADEEKMKNDKNFKASFYPFPDVIFVDGGSGHVEVVSEVLKKYGISVPVFGIVKDSHHRTDGLVCDGTKINMDKSGEAFLLLKDIQDEMHRRAISYHRKLRDGSALKTELVEIKGVGVKKATILFRHFKSLKAIKNASYDEISNIAGIDGKTAENVYRYFNGD